MTSSCSTVHVCTYVALITAMKTGPNNVSLEWNTEHVRGEGEESTEEGRNRGAGPLEAGWQGRPRPLHSFYYGLIPFFAREVWPVILHAHTQNVPHFAQKHFLSQHILSCPGQWPLHPSQASDGHEGSVGTCTSVASVPSEAGNMLM